MMKRHRPKSALCTTVQRSCSLSFSARSTHFPKLGRVCNSDTRARCESLNSALFLRYQHVRKTDHQQLRGGAWGGEGEDGGGGGGPVWEADHWGIDRAPDITPAPFTQPITTPADWCAANWAVSRVFMFSLQLVSRFRKCIVFYFNTIYSKGHPDVYLCQYFFFFFPQTAVRETRWIWVCTSWW